MSSSPRLTFGIELEFFLPQGLTDADPHPADPRWFVTAAQGADCMWSGSRDVLAAVERRLEASGAPFERSLGVEPEPEVPQCVYAWAVGTDASLQPCAAEDVVGAYDWLAHRLELRSRVLDAGNPRHLAEVDAVLARLRAALRVHVNSTCSTHVHVGIGHLVNGSDGSISGLEPLKRLVTLILLAEPFLYRLCEAQRRTSEYSQPVSTGSIFAVAAVADVEDCDPEEDDFVRPSPRLRRLLPATIRADLERLLAQVWAARSLEDLRDGLSTLELYERCGFALRGDEMTTDFYCATARTAYTVEFRQSHARSDPAEVRAWVSICVGLVRAAGELVDDDARFRAALASFLRGWDDGDADFRYFLEPLGLEHLLGYCNATEEACRRKEDYPPGPATEFLPPIS